VYPVADQSNPDRAADRHDVRAELGTSADAVVIVQASRLEAWKGHVQLLGALARLRDLDAWEGWIVGGPQRPEEARYLAELRDQAERDGIGGRVRFVGQRQDVPRVLAAADIHCQPNLSPEPFGIAFVEALYAGLPVVTAAQGGAAEILDETCALLTRCGDCDALAQSLRRLIVDADLRSRLGQAGPARARLLCDPGVTLGRLCGVLESVTAPRGRQRCLTKH
jgi:glycosyltransferase involved in cell wall biosynthesis